MRLLPLFALACAAAPPAQAPETLKAPKAPTARDFTLAAPEALPPKRTLWATNYYLPIVSHTAQGRPLRDAQGRALGPRLTPRDWCEAAMEGSVQIEKDGAAKTYNFARTRPNTEVDCRRFFPRHPAIGRTRFALAKGPFGDGVGGRVLVPFRTVAVDPKRIPLGSLVFIPDARGQRFTAPDGQTYTHDGYFLAGDIGGAIKGAHIDIFTGTTRRAPLSFIKSRSSGTFRAYLLNHDEHQRALEALHRPQGI